MNKLKYLIVFLSVALIAAEVEFEDDDWSASALRPGDVLSVNVFRVNDLSKTVRIEEDGTFIFPFCGAVPAVGKTPREIARDLEKLLELYEPLITKYSKVNGKLDEDLRQYQLIHIALNIS